MAQQNPSPLHTERPGMVSRTDVDQESSSADGAAAPDTEEIRGADLKKARGLDKASQPCGHNEAGTDQKVGDSKRLNHGKEKF